MTHPRRLRARLVRLLALLLLAVGVNVVIAWACAIRPRWGTWTTLASFGLDGFRAPTADDEAMYQLDRIPQPWFQFEPSRHGGGRMLVEESRGLGARRVRITGLGPNEYRYFPKLGALDDLTCGFPLPCLAATHVSLDPTHAGESPLANGWHDANELPASWGTLAVPDRRFRAPPKVLPLRPIWTGFAANIAFYAVLLAAPMWIHLLSRRWWRARAGLCVGCGYDVEALPVCPECGRASPHSEAGQPVSVHSSPT